jgi:hypothetical protein
MSCKTHENLEIDMESERQRQARYAQPENRHLWGVSDQRAAQYAKEVGDRVSAMTDQLKMHDRACPRCTGNGESDTSPADRGDV